MKINTSKETVMAWVLVRCWHSEVSIDRQAKDRGNATDLSLSKDGNAQRARDSRRKGDGGHDREECQNAQERQELPTQSQTEPVWGRETESGGKEAGPVNTRSCEKRSLYLHPPTHPSIYPSVHKSLCSLEIFLVDKTESEYSSEKRRNKKVGRAKEHGVRERYKWTMRRWRETVGVCLGVTGLRGAFSHRVVSEACRVLSVLVNFFHT